MPRQIQVPIQPYEILPSDYAGLTYTDAQRAVLSTKVYNLLIQLALTKRNTTGDSVNLSSLQEEAYLRGQLDFGLSLLGVSEAQLFTVHPDLGKHQTTITSEESDLSEF